MKQLQNNFTTPEQSNRLLGLGVPADSADCYYYDWAWIGEQYEGRAIQICGYGGYRHEQISHTKPIYPCWSVGRLMEIYDICFIYPKIRSSWCAHTRVKGVLFVDYILDCYKHAISDNYIDFSKLED